jgi:cold shock CspA family protein
VYTTPGGREEDSITFVVSDGELETQAEVRILIRTGNAAPTADADTFDLTQDETLRVAAPGVLANDSDLDNDELTVSLVSPPDHGELSLAADGSFSYTPDSGYAGGDKFVYAVTDVLGEQSTATVVLNISPIPVAVLQAVDDAPRLEVLAATTPLWKPPAAADASFATRGSRAIVAALHTSVATLPAMRYPLLLLAIALLVGLTIGRISILPFGAGRKHQEGRVEAYDGVYGTGRVVADDDEDMVFVQSRALVKAETLAIGQRVRFVSAVIRDRRIALKVWPI